MRRPNFSKPKASSFKWWATRTRRPSMPRVRDFRPASLHDQASPKLQVAWKPNVGFEGRVWQFLIFLPRWFLSSEGRTMICTAGDEALLEDLLETHFGGYTV